MNEMTETIFKAGQAIGPYRIVRCIGRGGMGEVYEVEHESLGVHYALKTFAYRGGAHRAFVRWLAGVTLRLLRCGSGEP